MTQRNLLYLRFSGKANPNIFGSTKTYLSVMKWHRGVGEILQASRSTYLDWKLINYVMPPPLPAPLQKKNERMKNKETFNPFLWT